MLVAGSSDEDEVEYLRDELEEQAAKIESLEQQKRVVIHEPRLTQSQRSQLQELKR